MDAEARGEVMDPIVLHDEDGQAFAFEVTDARGRAHAYRAASRLFFQGRDLLFLAPAHEPERAIAFEVRPGGRIEPIADERFLADLHAHLESPGHVGSAR